ncbi:HAMP domain-containing histidine kinase [Roseospira marina]|uniref:histidine kinase n=2 Tax=Roseospira marina TaxID=140057 RepID=A0A5M6IG51_9PROT|nr:HAMP domain-containing sensor histidine kinase [Roseospira marina]KAA5606857.1 HAMP domain-containing histidine kinase [Roseospira marina]MBB4312976.1 signal transduction histidine kinase [Roseospira marina]MBB5086251.1 signal transduction histidine kinase [Roseospira marina]
MGVPSLGVPSLDLFVAVGDSMSLDFDIRTLSAVLCMVLALSSLVPALLRRLHPGLPGPSDWTVGMVALGVGIGLIFGRNVLPPFWSIAIADVLVLLGHAFLVSGSRRFLGRPAGWPGLATITIIATLPITVTYAAPDTLGLRFIAIGLGMAALAFCAAWTLFRDAPTRLSARRIVAGLFVVHGVLNMLRVAHYWLAPLEETNLMQVGLSFSTLLLWSILFSVGLMAGLTVMVTERLRDALEARILDLDGARRTAEATLQNQRNFLAMVSHEFRTPLGIMAASADVIACNLPTDDTESAEEVERIRRASRRLGNLVEGCLASDWLETVSEDRRSQALDMGALLSDLASEYAVPLHRPSETLRVDGDPYVLPIAFSALLDNACKYGRTRAGVALTCRRVGTAVEVAVRDDGPGVDPAEVPRLFEKYYRAARTQNKPGAGLGLYLVRRIIDRHDGCVTLDQADGTVFRVTLPLLGA